METKKIRESNLELLRIISMISIFIYHYCVHGGILEVGSYTINKLVALFFSIGGRVGVNIFILIMGYFMVKSQFKIKRIIKLILQVLFYSIILAVISVYRLHSNFEIIDINSYFTPVLTHVYWFVTCYVIVQFLSPFLNKAIINLKQRNCMKLIVLNTIILSILPTIFPKINLASSQITWFIHMYIIGGYIREYDFKFKNKNIAKLISIGYPIIAYLTIIISILLNKYFNLQLDIMYYIGLYSFIGLIGSIGIFVFFRDIKIKENNIINFFAKTSFVTYLISDHVLYRDIFWTLDLKVQQFEQAEVYKFVFHIILSVVYIYIVSSIIETIRIKLIEEPIFKIKVLDKYYEKIDNWMNI